MQVCFALDLLYEKVKIGMTFGIYPVTIGFFGVINLTLVTSVAEVFLFLTFTKVNCASPLN